MKENFNKITQRLIYCFLVLMIVFSCKSDMAYNKSNPIEKQYFEDYITPENTWGYIGTRGKIIIDNRFDDARDFSETLAAVNYKGKWGFIDRSGAFIIEPKFKQVLDIKDSRTFAQDFNLDWWLLSSSGDTITKMNYTDYRAFRSGYAAVNINGKWGLIDVNGIEVVPPEYRSVKLLGKNAFALNSNGKWTIQNQNFESVIEGSFDNIIPADSAYIKLKRKDKWQLYHLKTRTFSKDFNKISQVQDGRAWAFDGQHFVLLDQGITSSITFEADIILPGGEGLWRFRKAGKWGFLNAEGRVVVPAQYDYLNQIRSGRAAFGKNENWGYIDKFGNTIVDPILPLAWDFKNGKARIIANGGFGVIDTTGNIILSPQFTELRDFYQGRARFQP